nr:reverse transcriptase domain-containing protein [Tanacetum cinerariifolium]
MSTRSSTRNFFPPLDNPELTIRKRPRVDPTLLNDFEMTTDRNGDPPVPDLRTMEELCQPTLNGRGGPIATIAIQATNFGLKNNMIQQVQNYCQFHRLSGNDANKHLDKFLHVTQSIKVNGVTDDALHLYLFTHSLTHHANPWLDRLPMNSINTFEKMAKMFLGKYFPPFMVTKLRNEITNFRQRPDESLFEAWEHYKLSIDRCPNHNMLPVTQINTFYNGLTVKHLDTTNAAAGGTFMKRSESSSSITSYFDLEIVALKAEMEKINKNLMKVLQINQQVKAVTHNYETCGGPHSYNDCPATVGQTQNVYAAGAYNQGGNSYQPQGASHGQNSPPAYQAPTYQAPGYKAQNMFGQFMKMNIASSSGSGTLPSNTITNPKEDMKGITTRSGNAYKGPTIPTTSSPPKVVESETEVTKNTVPPTNNESTKDVQPPVVQVETPIPNSEPVVAPVVEPFEALINAPKPNQKPSIPYPSILHDQKLHDKINDQKEKFFKIFQDSDFNISFADALILMPKSFDFLTGRGHRRCLCKSSNVPFPGRLRSQAVTFNLDQTSRYSANYDVMLVNQIDLTDVACEEYSQEVLGFFVSGNPTPSTEPIASNSSPTLTPFGNSDFLLEETDAFLPIDNEPISPEINDCYYDSEADILLFEEFLNDDPSSPPLLPQELKWFNTREGLIHEVIKKEVLKHLGVRLIYPISNSPWVSPVHWVPKKGGFTVVENEENELIPTRLVTGWRVCIDYKKLNDATHKDHFPLPFTDQMLERLAGNEYYCFLDGFSGYFQIPIDPQDQEKTTFTCPYGTFAYRRMPFGLCNAPGMFQRCMMAIFHDMIEKMMEVFMDDFSVFWNSFKTYLSHLDKMLKRCEDTNLCLNWEKSHFMVKEGIVFGHKISKNGIEVDKAKVDVIAKLPHLNIVKGAVLGQRKTKHFQPIHYASKMMTDAQAHYTMTEKELLAVVFGTPRAIISDRGTHFCNDQFAKVMLKYGVTHHLATAYHPQTSGQVEVSNHGLKRILERTVGENCASWSDKLDDALWAFQSSTTLERTYQRWLSQISKPSPRTSEFGDWVKLSDPKQALRGRNSHILKTRAHGFVLR